MTLAKTTTRNRSKPKPGKIALVGTMTIYQAATQKKDLLSAFNSTDDLEIDLSGVTEMDSAGLQLLVLLKREAVLQSKQVRLVAHSAASLDVLDVYNLGAYFGDPLVISSRIKAERRRKT